MWRALKNRVPGFHSQNEVWDLGIRIFQSSLNVQSRLRMTDLHHFPGHYPNVYFITLLGAGSATLPPLPAHSSQQIMNPKRGTWALCWSCIFPKSRMFAPWPSWMYAILTPISFLFCYLLLQPTYLYPSLLDSQLHPCLLPQLLLSVGSQKWSLLFPCQFHNIFHDLLHVNWFPFPLHQWACRIH